MMQKPLDPSNGIIVTKVISNYCWWFTVGTFLIAAILPMSGRAAVQYKLVAKQWYVATDGSDEAEGSINAPFATIQRAQRAVSPGETVFIRGGTYRMQESDMPRRRRFIAAIHILYKNGRRGKPITYRAYPGERPVFDCSEVKPRGRRVDAFYVSADWIHLIGLEVVGVQVTIKQHTQSICFHNEGNNNIYERLLMHDGQAIGIYSVRGRDNLFLNCDAWNNWDYTSEDGKGGNVDGFGCHPPKGGTGNVFRGCRAWNNSDDGFDCINASEAVTFENCWAFRNGFSKDGKRLADGNGFKVGGYASTPIERLPRPIPRHVTRQCIAFGNKSSGFYANHHPGGNDWFNNTAYRNSRNFNMLCREPDSFTDIPGTGHRMIKNLSYGSNRLITNLAEEGNELSMNTWDDDIRINETDWISLDSDELLKPRRANGELPDIEFLKPVASSRLTQYGAFAK